MTDDRLQNAIDDLSQAADRIGVALEDAIEFAARWLEQAGQLGAVILTTTETGEKVSEPFDPGTASPRKRKLQILELEGGCSPKATHGRDGQPEDAAAGVRDCVAGGRARRGGRNVRSNTAHLSQFETFSPND